jgi:hypothetical protein
MDSYEVTHKFLRLFLFSFSFSNPGPLLNVTAHSLVWAEYEISRTHVYRYSWPVPPLIGLFSKLKKNANHNACGWRSTTSAGVTGDLRCRTSGRTARAFKPCVLSWWLWWVPRACDATHGERVTRCVASSWWRARERFGRTASANGPSAMGYKYNAIDEATG